MARTTLFQPPAAFDLRVQELNFPDAALLLHVELGLALMERLGLDDEPVAAPWALLSGTPLRHSRLTRLDATDRRAIANARQIIPFSSRFAWSEALRGYFRLPEEKRAYRLPEGWKSREELARRDFEELIIAAARSPEPVDPANQLLYQQCLTARLGYRERTRPGSVKLDTHYQFEVRGERTLTVRFTSSQLEPDPTVTHWFECERSRQPFSVDFKDLEYVAQQLDERETLLARRFQGFKPGQWVRRFGELHFHQVLEDGTLSARNPASLRIAKFMHVAGMVGSGKSTLALLLAGHIVLKRKDLRLTLVVGDVQSALRLANQINWWLLNDPEQEQPVAVPLISRRLRDKHLANFHASRDYLEHRRRGQPHWGERWLTTACPLQGMLQDREVIELLSGKPILPGEEPCHDLRKAPPPDAKRPRKRSGTRYSCPFFQACPSHQLSRDLVDARVWITTPGGMAGGGLPRQLESRPFHVGELVYEQSDLVIFDEADTVMQWMDHTYAEEVLLTGEGEGIFDRLGVGTESHARFQRVMEPDTQRWAGAQRGAQNALTASLSLLSHYSFLREWVQRGYFTPNSLFYKLARLIKGFPEHDKQETTEEETRKRDQRTLEVLLHFDHLFDRETDPLRPQRLSPESESYRLFEILREIYTVGESATDDRIRQLCAEWIEALPPHNETLRPEGKACTAEPALQADQQDGTTAREPLSRLAVRLQFALTVALLDRHTRIVFYEWHSRPDSIDEEQPHRRMPAALQDLLPLPATGRQFGTYYAPTSGDPSQPETPPRLSLFAYTNIGRCYVLNFHRLLTDLDGRPGPNVLAMSGTSYLPDSSQFHVGPPHAVLRAEPSAVEAIATSTFSFSPQRSEGRPIRISGAAERSKKAELQKLSRALARSGGPLATELKQLHELSLSTPDLWRDRERLLLLVNSYDQSEWVADALRRACPMMQSRIYHVVREKAHGVASEVLENRHVGSEIINRPDVERFAQTGGQILVAPLNSIGRGFNILNAANKAAFGAIYFLIRPYPHPHDASTLAQELNRRTFDWFEDEEFTAWQKDGLLQRARELRSQAARYWRNAEQRSYYHTLRDDEELKAHPRDDLAATTAGMIIQAVGRLLRGGVPFHAYFVDAAWAPKQAAGEGETPDTPHTSLLAAVIDRISRYATESQVGNALYGPLSEALVDIQSLEFRTPERKL